MRRIHIALAVDDLEASVLDHSRRLGAEPVAVVAGGGERLRHLGFEDDDAATMTASTDVNGLVWEHFSAEQQAGEIEAVYGTPDLPTD